MTRGDPVLVEKGKWRFRIPLGRDPVTGQHGQRSVTVDAKNITEARRLRSKAIEEIKAAAIAPSKETFGFVIDKWLESKRIKQREANTLKDYDQKAEIIKKALGHIPLSQFDREPIQRFYAQLSGKPLAPATVQRYHAALNGACNYGVERGWMAYNPAQRTDRPPVRKPKLHVPSVEQVRDLLEASQEHKAREWHTFLALAVASWCRRGELAALRWDHVDFVNNSIFIEYSVEVSKGRPILKDTKSHANRRLSIDKPTMGVLADYRQWQFDQRPEADDSSHLFAGVESVNEPLHPDTFTDWFTQTRELVNLLRTRLHDIRHFGPTQALGRGVPLPQVSYRLGHAKVSTTLDMYIDFIPDRDKDVADFMGELMAPGEAIASLPPAG